MFVSYNCFSKDGHKTFDVEHLICIRSCGLGQVQGVLPKEIGPGPAFLKVRVSDANDGL